MSVQIYGKTYQGSQYKDIEEMTEGLFPGRDITKKVTIKQKRTGEPSILEWLKLRNKRAKERVEKGLPPKKPLYVSPDGEEDDISVLSGESAATTIEAPPLHRELIELDCYPPWSLTIPRLNDPVDHVEAIKELRSFSTLPDVETQTKNNQENKSEKTNSRGNSRSSTRAGSASSSIKSSSRPSSSMMSGKVTSSKQALAAAFSRSSNVSSNSSSSSKWNKVKNVGKFTKAMLGNKHHQGPHLVGISGALKPLHSPANLSWYDLEEALYQRESPQYLETGVEVIDDLLQDDEYCFRPLDKNQSLLEAISQGSSKLLADIATLTKEPPSNSVILGCVRRGKKDMIDICFSHGGFIALNGNSGYHYDGFSRIRKTKEEIEQEEMAKLKKKLLDKQNDSSKKSSKNLNSQSIASKNWSIAMAASKAKKKVLSKKLSVCESTKDEWGNDLMEENDIRSGGFPNLVASPYLQKRIAKMDAMDFLIQLKIIPDPALRKGGVGGNLASPSSSIPPSSPSGFSKSSYQSSSSPSSIHSPSVKSTSSLGSYSALQVDALPDEENYSELELTTLRKFVELNRKFFPPKFQNEDIPMSTTHTPGDMSPRDEHEHYYSTDHNYGEVLSPPSVIVPVMNIGSHKISPSDDAVQPMGSDELVQDKNDGIDDDDKSVNAVKNERQNDSEELSTLSPRSSRLNRRSSLGSLSETSTNQMSLQIKPFTIVDIQPAPFVKTDQEVGEVASNSPSEQLRQQLFDKKSSNNMVDESEEPASPLSLPSINPSATSYSSYSSSQSLASSSTNTLPQQHSPHGRSGEGGGEDGIGHSGDDDIVNSNVFPHEFNINLDKDVFDDNMTSRSQMSLGMSSNNSRASYGSSYGAGAGYGGYYPPQGPQCVFRRRQVFKEEMAKKRCGVRYYEPLPFVETMSVDDLIEELAYVHRVNVETPYQTTGFLDFSTVAELDTSPNKKSPKNTELQWPQLNPVAASNNETTNKPLMNEGLHRTASLNSFLSHGEPSHDGTTVKSDPLDLETVKNEIDEELELLKKLRISLKKHLKGRNLFARTFALQQQAGYSLLHLATHLGYTGVAMQLLIHEDKLVGYKQQTELYDGEPEIPVPPQTQEEMKENETANTQVNKLESNQDPHNRRASTSSFFSAVSAGSASSSYNISVNLHAAAASIASSASLQNKPVSAKPRVRRMLDGRDRNGSTPLHIACVSSPHFRQLKLIKALLDRGADANALDNRGRTPLHFACRSVDAGAIALLLANGADITIQSKPLPWENLKQGNPCNEFDFNMKQKQQPNHLQKASSPTSLSKSPGSELTIQIENNNLSHNVGGVVSSSPSSSSPSLVVATNSQILSSSPPSSPLSTTSKKVKKLRKSTLMETTNFELRSGGRHRRCGPDFGTIQGKGCGTCIMACKPEDRNEVYALLAAGCEEDEVRAMHATLISRSFVQDILNGFIRYDPTTKRSLHKTHAIRSTDGAYFLHIANKPPRGRWSDPRPGEVQKSNKDNGKKSTMNKQGKTSSKSSALST